MAPKVGFFTPVSFGTQPKSSAEWLLEKVDGWAFILGRTQSSYPQDLSPNENRGSTRRS